MTIWQLTFNFISYTQGNRPWCPLLTENENSIGAQTALIAGGLESDTRPNEGRYCLVAGRNHFICP